MPALDSRTFDKNVIWLIVTGAGIAVGVAGLGLPALIGPSELDKGLQIVGLGLTAVSAPFFVFELAMFAVARRLRPFESLPRDTHAAGAAAIENILAAFAAAHDLDVKRALSEHDRRIVYEVCIPVSLSTVERQKGRPLTRSFSFHITMRGIQEVERRLVADFEREAIFEVPADAGLTWSQVIPPTFVIDSRALNIDPFYRLAASGLIEVLWPLSGEWLLDDPEAAGKLANTEWLRVDYLKVGDSRPDQLAYPLASRPSTQELQTLLKAIPGAANLDYASLAKSTWMAGELKPESGLALESLGADCYRIESRTRFRTWIRDGNGNDLFRYNIPFWEATTVERIRFTVADDLVPFVSLLPAGSNCAFRLDDEKRRLHKSDQLLSWDYPNGDPAPFMPGHGVTFHWRVNEVELSRYLSAQAPATAS